MDVELHGLMVKPAVLRCGEREIGSYHLSTVISQLCA
jgi:hypothetical protein